MDCKEISFSSIEDALDALSRGDMIIVMDDENRENEGDLVMAACYATPEKIAFLLQNTTGILCAPMSEERADELNLNFMVKNNTCHKQTAFTVTVDAREGTTTGVSAADRAITFCLLADPEAMEKDDPFIKPGHVFPLRAREGGVLTRRGHTEATVDLCQLASIYPPVGVIGEIMDHESGEMKRLQGCYQLAQQYNLPIITVEQLVQYRRSKEKDSSLTLITGCTLPIEREGIFLGEWQMKVYSGQGHDSEDTHIIALVKGDVKGSEILSRVHSECITGNTLGSMRCDCNDQLTESLKMVANNGKGIILYVRGHEGRGIGLVNKIKAYKLQIEKGFDTYEANKALGFPFDNRSYKTVREIFIHLGVKSIKLITNNPLKVEALKDIVSGTIPLPCSLNKYNKKYIKSKRKMEKKVSIDTPETSLKEMPIILPKEIETVNLRIGIVRTLWNKTLVDALTQGCRETLISNGIKENNIVEISVPGAFELPYSASHMIQLDKVDAVLTLGVLIKGETAHFENISSTCAQGLMKVGLKTGIPILYGVLNCYTIEQAEKRCFPPSELPSSLGLSAIRMADLKRNLFYS